MSNIDKVKRIVHGTMSGDASHFKDLISDELKILSPVIDCIQPQESPLKTLIEVLNYWKRAFSGVKSEWTSTNEDSEGTVIVNWTAKAVHSGEAFLGFRAHGNVVNYNGTTTYTFSRGKLVKYHAEVDLETIKRQL